MKFYAVVKSFARKFEEILNRLRSGIGIKMHGDIAHRSLQSYFLCRLGRRHSIHGIHNIIVICL